MEHFNALPAQKQSAVISAALSVFGQNGYKKASTADVAAAAGISKAMIFHYFGSKKDMYLYLCEYCYNEMQKTLKDSAKAGDDFFDRVRYATEAKIALLKANTYMLVFLTSMYSESDPEVSDDLQRYYKLIAPSQEQFVVKENDAIKFKADINPEKVLQMLTWMGVGSIEEMSRASMENKLDSILASFYECLRIIKNNFYKEEYL